MKITLLGTGDAIGTPKIGCKCPTCMDALRGTSRRMRFSVLIESDEMMAGCWWTPARTYAGSS